MPLGFGVVSPAGPTGDAPLKTPSRSAEPVSKLVLGAGFPSHGAGSGRSAWLPAPLGAGFEPGRQFQLVGPGAAKESGRGHQVLPAYRSSS